MCAPAAQDVSDLRGVSPLSVKKFPIETQVTQLDFDLTNVDIDGTNTGIQVWNINSYGSKGLFSLKIDDDPEFFLNDDITVTVLGSDLADHVSHFYIPGDHIFTGIAQHD